MCERDIKLRRSGRWRPESEISWEKARRIWDHPAYCRDEFIINTMTGPHTVHFIREIFWERLQDDRVIFWTFLGKLSFEDLCYMERLKGKKMWISQSSISDWDWIWSIKAKFTKLDIGFLSFDWLNSISISSLIQGCKVTQVVGWRSTTEIPESLGRSLLHRKTLSAAGFMSPVGI